MIGARGRQTAYVAALLDAVLLCAAFALAFAIRRFTPLPVLEQKTPDVAGHFWLLTMGVPVFLVIASAAGLYDPARIRSGSDAVSGLLKAFAGLALFLGTAIFVFQAKGFSRIIFFSFLALGIGLLGAGKAGLHAALRRSAAGERAGRAVLIVGTGPEAVEIRRRIEAHPEQGLRVVGHLRAAEESTEADPAAAPVLGLLDDLKKIVESQVVDDVVFAVPFHQMLACARQVAWCEEIGVSAHLKADFVQTLVARTYPTDLDGIPMLTVAATPQDAVSLLVKRALDVVVSAWCLLLLSPVMIVCAILVRLTSAGPAFFRQDRVGLNGRIFTLLKFRSMYRDAERRRAELEPLNEASGPVFKIRRDPRITPVGRVLRRFSLDELPQLWNVLRGDMSLVGPRPPIPDEVKRYERWQRRRLSMKPGITCLWQVSGRSRLGFDEWMRLDLAYIDNWSLALDLKILLRTVPAVLLARGAQ